MQCPGAKSEKHPRSRKLSLGPERSGSPPRAVPVGVSQSPRAGTDAQGRQGQYPPPTPPYELLSTAESDHDVVRRW
eukprot:6582251-Prymnesium_polylepis.1